MLQPTAARIAKRLKRKTKEGEEGGYLPKGLVPRATKGVRNNNLRKRMTPRYDQAQTAKTHKTKRTARSPIAMSRSQQKRMHPPLISGPLAARTIVHLKVPSYISEVRSVLNEHCLEHPSRSKSRGNQP